MPGGGVLGQAFFALPASRSHPPVRCFHHQRRIFVHGCRLATIYPALLAARRPRKRGGADDAPCDHSPAQRSRTGEPDPEARKHATTSGADRADAIGRSGGCAATVASNARERLLNFRFLGVGSLSNASPSADNGHICYALLL